jgi:hypothetical protein
VPRLLLIAWVACLLVLPVGCKSEPPTEDNARFEVQLPEFQEFPDRNRHAKLKVAGKEQMVPIEKSGKTIMVDHKLDGKVTEVDMELSFWPVRYSNTIRKKTVKFKAGEVTKVDMTKADESDRFEAIFVETPDPVVEEMMKIGKVGKDDTVIDIGCGNGVVVIKAVKLGAKSGVGVDIQEWLVDESKKKAKEEGVADRCQFRVEDALKMTDLSPYSVVFLCLGEDLQTRLTPLMKKTLKLGSRVVAHTHLIEGWTPDQTTEVSVPGRKMKYPVYLWNIK